MGDESGVGWEEGSKDDTHRIGEVQEGRRALDVLVGTVTRVDGGSRGIQSSTHSEGGTGNTFAPRMSKENR